MFSRTQKWIVSLILSTASTACTLSRTFHGTQQVPRTPAHPLVGPVVVNQRAPLASGQPFSIPQMCQGLGEFPEFLRHGDAEILWQNFANQWNASAADAQPAFESAYATAFRGFERDLSRILREKRQYPLLRRFLSYTKEFGQWWRKDKELDFLTRGLIPEKICHSAIYATLMNYWVHSVDPLAAIRLVSQSVVSTEKSKEESEEGSDESEESETFKPFVEVERSFGTAWIVDGAIALPDAIQLAQAVRSTQLEGTGQLQWVWDLTRGTPSAEVQSALVLALQGKRLVSWIWGNASSVPVWTQFYRSYYVAEKVCEFKSAEVSVVAACEPVRAATLEGQDPQQDLWLAVFSRERARRLDLGH